MENKIPSEASFAQLVSASNISIDFFTVRQLSLREIAEDENFYNISLGALLFQKSNLGELSGGLGELTDFEIFSLLLIQDQEFAEYVQKALDLFVVEDIEVDNGLMLYGEKVITEDHWQSLQKILRQTNGLKEPETNSFNAGNEKAEKMRQKFLKSHQRVKELKEKQKKNDKQDSIFAMALTFSSKSPNCNLHEALNMSIPQFIHSFRQLVHATTNEDNYQMLLHGADSKKIKLSHWTELFKEE